MKRFVLLSLLVASVHCRGNGGWVPSSSPSGYGSQQKISYQQTAQSAPVSYGGGQSSQSSYGGSSQRLAPQREATRVSFGSSDDMGSNSNYGGSSQSAPSSYGGQQSAPASQSSYGGQQSAPASQSSYGGQQSAPASQSSYGGSSQRQAPQVESVRVSFASSDDMGSNYGGTSYNAPAPAAPVVVSTYGGQQSSPTSYGGGQSSPSSYGGSSQRQAPQREATRISFSSSDDMGSNYGSSSYTAPAPSSPSSYGGQQSAPAVYGQSQSSPSSYGGSSQRQAPQVESVRVSFASSDDVGSNYGGSSSYSAPTPSAPVVISSYRGSSDSGMYQPQQQQQTSDYGQTSDQVQYGGTPTRAVVYEPVRVSFNSGASNDGSYYSATSAAPAYGGSSSSDSYGGQSSEGSYGGGSSTRSAAVPVESVRVSFGTDASRDSGSSPSLYGSSSSTSSDMTGSYGSANDAPSSYGGSSSSSYGGVSTSTRNTVPILRHTQEISPAAHSYDYATGDGTSHSENTSSYQGGNAKHGRFSYISPEGQKISLSYQADTQGFRAQGEHLPTSPPIPAEIAKSLRGSGYGSTKSSVY